LVNHSDRFGLISPRNCVHCGQALTASAAAVDSTDPSASDTDYERADDAASGTTEHPPARAVVSDPSLVSSRSSTPQDGYLPPPPPPPLTASDDECASLLSSDVGGYVSSDDDDLDSEYVSALEVPEPQPGCLVTGVRESADSVNELDEADVFGSTWENANEEFDVNITLDYDDDDEDDDDDNEDSLPLNSTLTGGATLQESSNSASTLHEDVDELPQENRQTASGSSSDDDSDDEGTYHDEMTLFADESDDADGEESCLAPGNNPIEPLLAPAGDSDQSDAN